MKYRKTDVIAKTAVVILSIFFIFSFLGCGRSSKNTEGLITSTQNKMLLQAEKIVLDALADRDSSLRTKAIEVIADTRQIKFMPKVVKRLNDPSVPVRFSAALAVGDTSYLIGKKNVRFLLHDKDENVRIAAAYALYKLSETEKIEIIQNAVKSRDQTIRANATLLLGKCGDKNSLPPIYWAMRDRYSDYKVGLQAAQAIASLKDEKIYPKLWTMLISSYADDRVMGIRGMGALATPAAKDSIISMLDDEILEVRLVAAEQLGKCNINIGEPEVLDVFQKELIDDFYEESRKRAYILTAMAIAQIKTDELKKYLPKLINDPDKSVQIAAARAVFLVQK
ncbi:MAG: HEAT repeat domain-containing protein [Planctomycetota bacterium]|jgi:HEAT repeat protein